jgi:hypothetical protein
VGVFVAAYAAIIETKWRRTIKSHSIHDQIKRPHGKVRTAEKMQTKGKAGRREESRKMRR